MLLMLFQTAAAITEIYFGKARVLVCIKNWIGEMAIDYFWFWLLFDFRRRQQSMRSIFKKARIFQTQKLFQFASKTEEEKTLLCLAISSLNIRIIFCLLTLRFCIQRSWGLCAILLYPTSRPHSYPLLQTSWLPVKVKVKVKVLKRDWKWIGKCKRESESPHSYPLLQTSWLPEK